CHWPGTAFGISSVNLLAYGHRFPNNFPHLSACGIIVRRPFGLRFVFVENFQADVRAPVHSHYLGLFCVCWNSLLSWHIGSGALASTVRRTARTTAKSFGTGSARRRMGGRTTWMRGIDHE